jgi:hypothetical protein
VVISDIATREMPNDIEYITPQKVFLYTKKIKRPKTKEMIRAIAISNTEKDVTFSKKLDLNTSLKVIIKLLLFILNF